MILRMKLDQLTFTRFLAAFAIVVFHYGVSVIPFNKGFLHSIFTKANLGVSYFFILSGFVMVIAYLGKGAKINYGNYYLNRIARIYPVYTVALIITTFEILSRGGFDIKAFILNLVVIQAWFPKYATSLNFPGWSLSVEFLFYALFPLLYNYIYRVFSIKLVAIYILFFWLLTQVLCNYLLYSGLYNIKDLICHNFIYYFPLMHLNEFLIGNLTAFIYLRYRANYTKNYDWQLYALAAIILLCMALSFNININLNNGLMNVLFAPFIIILSLNNGKITQLLSKKAFIVLGEISYSIYILQFPVHAIVNVTLRKFHIFQPVIVFYIFSIILLVISYFSHYLIEVPANNMIRNMFKQKNIST